MILFIALSAAYSYRFQEDIVPDVLATEDADGEDGTETRNDEVIGEDVEGDDEKAEEEKRKKNRNYGVLATLGRLRRLMPYIVPLKSRGTVALTGESGAAP